MMRTGDVRTLTKHSDDPPVRRGGHHLSLALLCAASLILALLALVSWAAPARANTFVVTKTEDTADGACDADCSLREAIVAANADPASDIITVPAGVYTLASDTLVITGSTTINGAGAGATVIDGAFGGFSLSILGITGLEGAPITVTLTGLTLRHGGNGITANYVNLVVSRTEIISNTNFSGNGAGIDITAGALTLQSSTVAWNSNSGGTGGGIQANSADVTVADSTIVSNTATEGAGIRFVGDVYTLTVRRSAISYNTSSGGYGWSGHGGGIYATGGR
jgi:CSLREA domain-containing protein